MASGHRLIVVSREPGCHPTDVIYNIDFDMISVKIIQKSELPTFGRSAKNMF
jgi:hypothetical protein